MTKYKQERQVNSLTDMPDIYLSKLTLACLLGVIAGIFLSSMLIIPVEAGWVAKETLQPIGLASAYFAAVCGAGVVPAMLLGWYCQSRTCRSNATDEQDTVT